MNDSTDTMTTAPAAKTYDWREDMRQAGVLKDRAATNNKQAGQRLWRACQAGITEWLPEASADVNGENLYGEFIAAYGESRKGDCSKMKTVALAVKNNGLVLATFDNLSKAYAEARRLTQTVAAEKAEDEAADKAIEALAAEAPHSATTGESAAKIVLSKGLDEAARLLLDALGASNEAAHRALLRAISAEIAGRVKPQVKAVASGPKAGAVQATGKGASPKAAVKTAGTKAKQPAKGKPVAQSASKGDPNKKALPPKGKPAQPGHAQAEKVETGKPEHTTADTTVEHGEQAAPVAKKAVPVKRAVPVKKAAPVSAE